MSKSRCTLKRMDGTPKYLHEAARRFLAKLAEHVDFSKPVKVVISPGEVIECPDGKRGYGVFHWGTKVPTIFMAGKITWLFKEMPKSEAIPSWLFTLAHEVAHYEQWRDGRAMTERGVDKRAEKLMKLCGY